MSSPKNNKNISLEELLRWKRHEQPSQEFWDDFDQNLKEKTLVSIVRQRAWYDFSNISLANIFRILFPAMAVFAFAIFGVSVMKSSRDVALNVSVLSLEDSLSTDIDFFSSKYEQGEITVLSSDSSEDYAYENFGSAVDTNSNFGFSEVSLASFDGKTQRVFF